MQKKDEEGETVDEGRCKFSSKGVSLLVMGLKTCYQGIVPSLWRTLNRNCGGSVASVVLVGTKLIMAVCRPTMILQVCDIQYSHSFTIIAPPSSSTIIL